MLLRCSTKSLWCLRADSRFAPSQWEMSLRSNAVSHWLDANLESALCLTNQLGTWNNDENWLIFNGAKHGTMKQIVKLILTRTQLCEHTLTQNLESERIILCVRSASERWCYSVTPSLIGWAHTQNDPWKWLRSAQATKISNILIRALIQYRIRCLIVRAHKVLKMWDWLLKCPCCFGIWQEPRQHYCRNARQISEQFDNLKDLVPLRLWNQHHLVKTKLGISWNSTAYGWDVPSLIRQVLLYSERAEVSSYNCLLQNFPKLGDRRFHSLLAQP